MVICVFGSANEKIDEIYKTEAFNLGKALAEKGHSLIFGAGGAGLMGATARGFHAGNGKVHGVIPKFFEENGYEDIYYKADQLTYTTTMAERKTAMEDGCEAFVIVPGGVGTFEEFFEIYTLKQLGRHQKAIAILNTNGYYDTLLKVIDECMEKGFINKECKNLAKVFDNVKDVVDYVENYSTDDIVWGKLKRK